jgi:hypothetical protein
MDETTVEPETLWGGEAVRDFVVKLTHEKDLTMSTFYQRAKRGAYGPLRKIGQTLVSTPRELRTHLTGRPTP